MFARVLLCARDDLDGLMRLERAAADRTDPPRQVLMTRSRWDEALEAYYADHHVLDTGADARGPELLVVGPDETGVPGGADEDTTARIRRVRQTLHDPEGHHDWVLDGVVDCDASDAAGELVLTVVEVHRL